MSSHAKYSGSKTSQFVRCPGSVDFVQYLISKSLIPKEETSVYADEGTMLHDQQDLHINQQPFNKELTAEQLECIQDNTKWFKGLSKRFSFQGFSTELKKDLSGYGILDAGGTADVVAIGRAEGVRSLHVIDWKFGQGVFVECNKNEQLMSYLLCVIGSEAAFDDYDELWIHIGQPRLDNFSSYLCTKEELLGLLNAIKNAIKSHDINPGQKQCQWCRGKVTCAEYAKYVTDGAAQVFGVNDKMKNNVLDFKEMARVLKFEPLFKQAFKAIRDHMAGLNSENLAEFKLKRVAGRSNRTFADKGAVVKYLVENYEIDDVYEEPKLKSPAKLEKSIKGLKKDKGFQELIYKPVGKPTLVDLSDARPEFDGIGAKGVFSHLKK